MTFGKMRDAASERLWLADVGTSSSDEEDEAVNFLDESEKYLSKSKDYLDSSSICDCEISDQNHFDQLKETTERLKLATRRPSYTAWREQYLGKPFFVSRRPVTIHESVFNDEDVTKSRKAKIEESLEWLKEELMEMKNQDKLLACRLLSLRKDIHHFKLQKGLREHEELLDEAEADFEDFGKISELCDMPVEEFRPNTNPLKQLGVTRLNLSSRRFSTC